MSELEKDYKKMKAKLSAFEKENQRLRGLLEQYGKHLDLCALNGRGIICDCGFVEALAASGGERKVNP